MKSNARQFIENYLNNIDSKSVLNEEQPESVWTFSSKVNNRNYFDHPYVERIQSYLSDKGLSHGNDYDDDYYIGPNDPDWTDFEGDDVVFYSLNDRTEGIIYSSEFKRLARRSGLDID